ncbi:MULTISPECIES: branched-chain amino acid ABC transporter permease [Paracoccus]|jgi:branched-chain amino acid transport system permease protein|uniref:branched-chain amino acid ABC transporter permease n=1 Tax=Paracoccus TaxID=265 RepID=UPI002583BE90|nr:branched-chain amino acid ABC transporter permease [Paracoccus sp. (in: a-proteobacteria)]
MIATTLSERRVRSRGGLVGLAVIAATGLCLPFASAGQPFLLMLASHALIAAILALSLDMLTGNTGLLSFGHAAWYGFGAYVAGLLSKSVSSDIAVLILLTLAATLLVSGAVGAILVRQVGKTFAILTLALSQIMFALVFVFSDITGGEDGLQGIPMATSFGAQIVSPTTWYAILLGALLLALAGALHIRRAPLGRAWLAIRENSERARFIGMNVTLLKLISYMISASLASLAGVLFVLFNGATSPDLLHWLESGKVLMYVVLGGVGTIFGPVIGAVVFTLAEHYVSSFTDAWLIYFGALFVLIVIVAPGGLFGGAARIATRLSARKPGRRAAQ